MSNKKKKLDEMSGVGSVGNTAANIQGASDVFRERRNRKNGRISAPFTETVVNEKTVRNAFGNKFNTVTVVEPKSKKERQKGTEPGEKKNKKTKKISLTPKIMKNLHESKSEKILRESIRNLVLLNRVKYHEEEAKRELQEQKLRHIIRHLIMEADEANKINYSSTGETSAASFMKKISVTMDEYASLKSTQAQREEFKKIYLTGIKIYLDALDQQYYILNPEERGALGTVGAPTQGMNAPQPTAPPAPAKRSDRLQEAAPAPINAKDVNPLSNINTKAMRTQATTAAVQAVGVTDKTGHGMAENALNRDLPQIDPLYINLTFKQFSAANADGSSRMTSDRKDFRMMLIGDSSTNTAGNIANEFTKLDLSNPTNDSPHKGDPSQTPPLTPQPLPNAAAQPAPPVPAPTAPPSAEGGSEELPEI